MIADYTNVPLSPLRKVIAARMSEAKRTIPHFRIVADIDLGPLMKARVTANAECSDKASLNDCLIRGCAVALQVHPGINVQFVDDAIRQYHDADISIIVDVGGGVTTPVIRKANRKSVWTIAAEMRTFKERAIAGQLKMQDIIGGSFSISNLGAYGVDQFDAIINPPQCAILAVGRAAPRVAVGGGGNIDVANMLRATLSVDHRAIDGVAAAKFMSTLRDILGQPQSLFST